MKYSTVTTHTYTESGDDDFRYVSITIGPDFWCVSGYDAFDSSFEVSTREQLMRLPEWVQQIAREHITLTNGLETFKHEAILIEEFAGIPLGTPELYILDEDGDYIPDPSNTSNELSALRDWDIYFYAHEPKDVEDLQKITKFKTGTVKTVFIEDGENNA